jgi:Mycothiol maleylpyruvate isomerase N-terminal domain
VITVAGGDTLQIADVYHDTKERITGLLTGPEDSVWEHPVAACPGWSVRDVVAHMTAVAHDWADGQLAGPPTDKATAEHIRRFDDHDESGLLQIWSQATARLHHLADTTGLEPPLGDIACHEHDIRSAIGRPGARDAQSVHWTSDRLLAMLYPPVPLRVVVENSEFHCGPPEGIEIVLRTTWFEALRWRTGRRSRAQLAAMDWSTDPTPALDHLCIFGPATADIIE